MRDARSFLILLALAIPAGVAAAGPRVGKTILSGCRQGECAWLRVLGVGPPAATTEGVLRRMTARRGTSLHPDGNLPEGARHARIEWEAGEQVNYAFCSRLRPAFAFQSGQDLVIHYLDLFDLAGYQQASGALYMRLCHDRKSVPGAAGLRKLGYQSGTRSEQAEAATPEAMTRF